jgi:hypothetical protein
MSGRVATILVYTESINMLEGLTEEEADTVLHENPTLVPLYKIDVVKEAEPYQYFADAAVIKLGRAREALEQEVAVSQRVRATEPEELNLGTIEEPRNVLVAKELDDEFKEQLTNVLRVHKEVFAWSYEDMKALNPEILSSHDKPGEGCNSGAATAVSAEPELCGKSQKGDRQAPSGRLY